MTTKTDGISGGLLVVAWLDSNVNQEDSEMLSFIEAKPSEEDYADGFRCDPLVRLSDAEAIISQQAERIKDLEAERGDSQFCAGCNEAAKTIEKQSAALKLARVALSWITKRANYLNVLDIAREANEALAAIDALKGE